MTSPALDAEKLGALPQLIGNAPETDERGTGPYGRRRIGQRYCVDVGDAGAIGCCGCSAAIASWVLKAGATFSWSSV